MSHFWTVGVLRFVPSFFVIAVCVGIYSYPGGNIHDADQIGYSLTNNFLSDLGGYQSHSGDVNFIASFFFNVGMFLFCFATNISGIQFNIFRVFNILKSFV